MRFLDKGRGLLLLIRDKDPPARGQSGPRGSETRSLTAGAKRFFISTPARRLVAGVPDRSASLSARGERFPLSSWEKGSASRCVALRPAIL